ncbi:CPBP family glutamic-type intramembrane protease [Nocardia blacklockiae]|uniref:CPBP family glutamic-type intramembrane protease n=1 Tax=Nocardia blacklockiae TaxID=480036 RepID=UPI0018933D95|nr:CPBP family glutamic-type intramembrane protease [Nocardia blacklockiae]MBF6173026.1 CPBP family intramembrane metalloprotease [Nocardia blacklockiae]
MSTARAAFAAALPLLWSNVLLPRTGFGIRGRTAANAAFATTYALTFHGRPNWLSARGFRWGAAAAATVIAGYAAALAIPPVRARIAGLTARAPEVPLAEWVTVHIPLGTVYSEELIFRATLDPLLESHLGTPGRYLSPTIFALWHIHPARAAGDHLPTTLTTTAAAGTLFSWLRRHTTSTTAPALLHLSLNTGGALTPPLATHLNHQPQTSPHPAF